tara:strand:- start:1613 stop:2002 length:390 start_codon:yes stop_codon:yes gene_type:complete
MAVTINSSGEREHWTNPVKGQEVGTFGGTVEQQSQGSKVVGSGTVQLTDSDIPCEYVWLCAPTANHSAGVNDGDILIGTSSVSNNVGGVALVADRYEGVVFPIKNANLLYLTGFNAGDVVEYQIFRKPE